MPTLRIATFNLENLDDGPDVRRPSRPARHTLFHLGRGLLLDHVFVSRPFAAFYRGSEIHNEVLPDESGAFRDDTTFPESDHAPLAAAFEIP